MYHMLPMKQTSKHTNCRFYASYKASTFSHLVTLGLGGEHPALTPIKEILPKILKCSVHVNDRIAPYRSTRTFLLEQRNVLNVSLILHGAQSLLTS
jgi:hypothetical protein